MHARVGTYEGGDAEGLVKGFDSQTDKVRALDGFAGAHFLVDRDTGKGISITLWDSEEALEASLEATKQMREDAVQPAGARVVDVSHYEVAISLDA